MADSAARKADYAKGLGGVSSLESAQARSRRSRTTWPSWPRVRVSAVTRAKPS